ARLAVEVAAEQHRQAIGIAARAAGEHVADGVNADRQPGGLAFGAEAVAPALVNVCQGEAADPAFWRGTDKGHRHQAVPQPFAVDTLVGLSGHAGSPNATAHLARRAVRCKTVPWLQTGDKGWNEGDDGLGGGTAAGRLQVDRSDDV